MKKLLFLIIAAMGFAYSWAQTPVPPATITDQNASLTFNPGNPVTIGHHADPRQFPTAMEWIVDGRSITVYPSAFTFMLDISHAHPGGHVASNQLHAHGPFFDYETDNYTGRVYGGVVYTLTGSANGTGASRIVEKIDIVNKSGADLPLVLAGMGWMPDPVNNPSQQGMPVPNLDGLTVTGITTAFYQGSKQATSITDPPYASVTPLPAVSFSGKNPQAHGFSLPDGATLTVFTELNVSR